MQLIRSQIWHTGTAVEFNFMDFKEDTNSRIVGNVYKFIFWRKFKIFVIIFFCHAPTTFLEFWAFGLSPLMGTFPALTESQWRRVNKAISLFPFGCKKKNVCRHHNLYSNVLIVTGMGLVFRGYNRKCYCDWT